jgi:hypothetical protein
MISSSLSLRRFFVIDFAYERVESPQAMSLNPVCRLDTLPVEWFSVFGKWIFRLLEVRTISMVSVRVDQSVNARST